MKKLFAALGVCFLLFLTSTSAHAERRIYSYTSYNTWNGEPLDIYVGANENSGFVTGALEGAISCTVGVYEGDSYAGAPRFGRSPDGVWYAYDAELNRFMPLAYFNSELLNNVLRTVLSDEFQQAVREEIAEAEARQAEAQRQEELRKLREQERKNKEAEAFYNQTQAASPYVDQAIEFYKQGKYKEGDEAIEHAYLIAPTFEDIYWVYYHAYEPKHKWNKIEELFSRGIDKGIRSSDIIYWRGYAFYKEYLEGQNFLYISDRKRSQLLAKTEKIQRSIVDIKSIVRGKNRKFAEELYTALNRAISKLKQ